MSDATALSFAELPDDKAYVKDDGPPSCRTRTEVGDTKQPTQFYPQLKVCPWDNECNFSVRLEDADYTRGTVRQTAQGIEWVGGDRTARFYDKADARCERGEFEFEIELAGPPASNVVRFTIQSKALVFEYQPPLSDWEIKRGCTRPDEIVGSYAVYHATQKNNIAGGKSYFTGKAFHITRPWAEDAKGTRVWCDLNIDAAAGLMTITIPQAFLDAAVYPVLVDPTYGYTSAPGTEDGTDDSAVAYDAGTYTGTNGLTIASAVVYGRTTGTPGAFTVEAGLYSDSGGTTRPASRQALVSESKSLSNTMAALTINQTSAFALQNGTKYWPAACSNLGAGWRTAYDTVGAVDDSFQSGVSTLPATWTQDGSSTPARLYGIYFNLSGGSSPTVTPTGMSATMQLGTPSVQSTSNPTVTPSGLSSTMQLGTPTVQSSSNPTVTPTGLSIPYSLGTFTIQNDITLTGIAGFSAPFTVGTPTVNTSSGTIVTPTGLSAIMQLGTPALNASSTLTPAGFSALMQLGTPTFNAGTTVSPVGLSAPMQLGTPAIQINAIVVSPVGFSSLMQLGSPTIQNSTAVAGHRQAFSIRLGLGF